MKYFQFNNLLQASGWVSRAYLGIDELGNIQYLSADPPAQPAAIEYVNGFALPGFQNAHSHAFQFGMAGMAEKHESGTKDDFWSWREAMYECALGMNPDQMEQVATACYKELVRNGYTHVAEFHYLHHNKNGQPYSNLAEMGERLLSAASEAGIKITLVPVFYQRGGLGKDPQPRQRRFISKTIDDYFHLLDDTAHAVTKFPEARLGYGVHSLRAVNPEDIIRTAEQGPKEIPFHLHAAEQLKEVEDCILYLNKRPIEWLLENIPLSDRFHVVHGTHMNDEEVEGLATSKAHAVLCPGTEGNLGDGIFRLTDFHQHGGSWSIGTDSHISLNPLEDLRWLDYAQRFTTHKRNTFDDSASTLIHKTILAGRKAMGISSVNYFAEGQPLDAVVYKAEAPLIKQAGTPHALQTIVYTADSDAVMGTLVNGQWIYRNV